MTLQLSVQRVGCARTSFATSSAFPNVCASRKLRLLGFADSNRRSVSYDLAVSDKKQNPITYSGKDVDVTWDKRLCIHVGECGRASGELFVGGRDPWCQPDTSNHDDVLDVVERCPTGALVYIRKDGGATEVANATNVVVVSNNGPIYLRGSLDIEGAQDDMPGVKFRAALCRCGKSAQKPFCDGRHETEGFIDRGAVGDKGSPLTATDGVLSVKRAKNGPLLVNGNFKVINSSGREAWSGTKAALCRCGASANKPFCDGAHRTAGFEAD